MRKPIVAIIGRPNVGKSTLFNRLIGRRIAIVEDEPGTTRDRLHADVSYRDKAFTIVDTGGLVVAPKPGMASLIKKQVTMAIDEADAIIFVVDVLDGITGEDKELAELLRRSGKPVVVAANKSDNDQRGYESAQFYKLAIGDPIPISAYHGLGVSDLLDKVAEHLPRFVAEEEQNIMKVAIVGRPNVGKSMLLNAIVGEERVIVSDKPGTTRDAIDTIYECDGERMMLIDTAGIRRRGRVDKGIEFYSVDRAMRSIDRADVALLVIEAKEMLTAQDIHVAGYIHEACKGAAVVVNKWDLVEGLVDKRQCTVEMRSKLKFMPYAPILYTSAIDGMGIEAVLEVAKKIYKERNKRIATPLLNNTIRDAVAAHSAPSRRGKKLNILYVTQADINPPTFVFSVNDAALLHFSYQRYMENQLRKSFGFRGTPIRLFFRQRGDK
jgi:GTP-binding protein